MPFSVIVVEDEAVLRASFIRHVNWDGCGFSVIYDCSSAEEAVEYMQQNGFPDVVFTDIRLFAMSGIDLCQFLQANNPSTRKLLLSGYSDFEYAKQAISYHVDEYLLKPVKPSEVEKILSSYAKQWKSTKSLTDIQQLAHSNHERYVESVLSELVCGSSLKNGETPNFVDEDIVKLFSAPYICICIKYILRKDVGQAFTLGFTVQEYFQKEFNVLCKNYFFGIEHRRLVGFCLTQDSNSTIDLLRQALNKCAQLYPGIILSAGVSLPTCEIVSVQNAYEQAAIACSCAVSFGNGCVSGFPQTMPQSQNTPVLLWNEQLTTLLTASEWKKAVSLLQKQLEIIKENQNTTFETVQQACVDLITHIYHEIIPEQNNDIAHLLSVDIVQVMSTNSIDEINQTLARILQHCELLVQDSYMKSSHNSVDTIITYLQNNYSQAISLEDLSRTVFLNPRYICSLIKRNTGKTFYEILTEIRINKACELLKDPSAKIYEISNIVGFRDTKIFNKAFKRVTQKTPSQYRQEL